MMTYGMMKVATDDHCGAAGQTTRYNDDGMVEVNDEAEMYMLREI